MPCRNPRETEQSEAHRGSSRVPAAGAPWGTCAAAASGCGDFDLDIRGATHHWVPWRKSAWMRLIVKWGGWETLKLSPGPVASQASLLRITKAYKSIFLGSLHTCRLTLHMLVSRNFVQKWRTAPKANSDDFSPPGSQEPCLHQRLNTGPSEVMSFKFLYIQEDI
jgi:hypothetical protein